MLTRFAAAAIALVLCATLAQAQQPVPLYPGAGPRSIEPEPLPPLPGTEESSRSPGTAFSNAPPLPPAMPGPAAPASTMASPPQMAAPTAMAPPSMAVPPAPGMADAASRIFCEQSVSYRVADRDALPDRFRPFIGIWSDAAWTPQLCAALIVENVSPDGTASIVYVFGPMGSNGRAAGGVLRGTGIVRDGELRFQNVDGSQFAFRPLYADLDGHLTTPQGQTYGALFKKTL